MQKNNYTVKYKNGADFAFVINENKKLIQTTKAMASNNLIELMNTLISLPKSKRKRLNVVDQENNSIYFSDENGLFFETRTMIPIAFSQESENVYIYQSIDKILHNNTKSFFDQFDEQHLKEFEINGFMSFLEYTIKDEQNLLNKIYNEYTYEKDIHVPNMDWIGKLQIILINLNKYLIEVIEIIKTCDNSTLDILHKIEMEDESYDTKKIVRLIKETRTVRRQAKNLLEILSFLKKSVNDKEALINKINQMSSDKKYKNRA